MVGGTLYEAHLADGKVIWQSSFFYHLSEQFKTITRLDKIILSIASYFQWQESACLKYRL